MEYADYVKTGTMPPVLTPEEGEEERKRREAMALGTRMPPVRSAANATATMPTSRGFSAAAMDAARGGAMPTRDAADPDSREFFQRAWANVRPQAGVATPAPPGWVPGPGVDPNNPNDPYRPIDMDVLKGRRVAPQPQSAAPSTSMPPVPLSAPAPRSSAFSGAPVKPLMPPYRVPEPVAEPDLGGQKMPPFRPVTPGDLVSGEKGPAAPATQTMPPVPVGPEMQRYQDLAAKGDPKLSWWKKVLDVIGSIHPLGRFIESEIPGTPQNYDAKLYQAAVRAAREQTLGKGEQERETAASQAQFNTPEKRRAYMQKNPDLFEDVTDFQKHDWVLSGKFPQKEPAPEKTTDKKIDEYVNEKGQRVLTFQRADNSTYDKVGGQTQPKPAGHTSAFEAFAYGTPEEKKAAQDYIDLEKKSAARYRTPSEFDEKFRLFKEDPETYKAMFGDKGGAGPDRATATRMLNYFDRRRREVNQDFTLDDAQKQEQLKDIENLEKPFLEAVQPGNGGRAGDRVEVIHPNGQHGTIPRSQLGAAKRKGYKEAPGQ